MSPKPSLRAFLSLARAKLSASPAHRESPLTLVAGNESADLDSLCSAVIFAYLHTVNAKARKIYIPISNLPRDDLPLRSEMTAVLARAGLEPRDLLTLDDLPHDGRNAASSDDMTLYLVDHNSPSGIIKERYGTRIVGCVDHHADENFVSKDVEARVIETSGSCVSLIVEHYREAWDSLAREAKVSQDAAEADKSMALMALGVIFSDTVNLRAKDRVTPWDVRAVEYLEEKLGGTGYEREKYCDEIDRVRRDLDGLSLRDIFRKDYKEWVEGGIKLGTSAVIQNFDYLLGRAGGSADVLMGELGKWAEEKSLDLVSVMTLATHDGRYEREVLLWGRNEKAAEASRDFERAEQAELDLHTFRDGLLDIDAHGQWGRAWKQGNLKHSRKQIAPMIRDAMRRV